MVSITDDVLGTNCNLTSISIVGTNDWETIVADIAVAYGLSDD
jgi:hypothetical protein